MDEEYDVIVLGTGLTVSAASGARGPALSPLPLGSAAPGPIQSLPSRRLGPPKKQPRAHSPRDVASTLRCGRTSKKRPPSFPSSRLPQPLPLALSVLPTRACWAGKCTPTRPDTPQRSPASAHLPHPVTHPASLPISR